MTVQSSVCVIGISDKPDSFYILVDDIMYKVKSTVRCLELILKLFHSLGIEYPEECESVWFLYIGYCSND